MLTLPSRQLPVSSRPDSVAFPRTGDAWTPEQRNAIWGGDVRKMLHSLLTDASQDADFMTRLASQQRLNPTSVAVSSLSKAAVIHA